MNAPKTISLKKATPPPQKKKKKKKIWSFTFSLDAKIEENKTWAGEIFLWSMLIMAQGVSIYLFIFYVFRSVG